MTLFQTNIYNGVDYRGAFMPRLQGTQFEGIISMIIIKTSFDGEVVRLSQHRDSDIGDYRFRQEVYDMIAAYGKLDTTQGVSIFRDAIKGLDTGLDNFAVGCERMLVEFINTRGKSQ